MKVKIEKLQFRDLGESSPSRYGNPNTQHTDKFYQFLVNGIDVDTNELVYFFTPQIKVNKCVGMMNYEKLYSENGWMEEIEGEMKGVKGFDGSLGIFNNNKIVPSIHEGDIIEVNGNHTWTSPKNGAKKYNRVKLIK